MKIIIKLKLKKLSFEIFAEVKIGKFKLRLRYRVSTLEFLKKVILVLLHAW